MNPAGGTMRYEHSQSGGPGRWVLLAAAVGLLAWRALDPADSPPLAVIAVLAVVLLLFDRLTIGVGSGELAWRFGYLGWPRWRLPLTEIVSATVTRTAWLEGWGIRLTRRGWLYNVSGLDAVLILRRDGKTLLLGSDEAPRLARAINEAVAR